MSATETWVHPRWWSREARALRRLGLAVEATPGGFTIRPAKGSQDERVRLTFTEDRGRPRVTEIRNYSSVGGWGRRMVTALCAIYPGEPVWASTELKDSGVAFWVKMQREFGIVLVRSSGSPLLSDEQAAAHMDRIAAAERATGAYTTAERTSQLPSLDRRLP